MVALAASACGDGSPTGAACDDASFRAQDEELYVAHAVVVNAVGGGGDAAIVLTDLRRARAALANYLDAHPPCDEGLAELEKRERGAIGDLDSAITALEKGTSADLSLRQAQSVLAAVQDALVAAP